MTDAATVSHSPRSFEESCAQTFADVGFDTTLNGGPGDQGADIVAVRDGRRVVVQCRLYSAAVGNKAVQEVVAARACHDAHLAMVVSNQGFTTSARQLAQEAEVLLVDVQRLPDVLGAMDMPT